MDGKNNNIEGIIGDGQKSKRSEFCMAMRVNGIAGLGAIALPTAFRKWSALVRQDEQECLRRTGRLPTRAVTRDYHDEIIYNPEYEEVAKFSLITVPPILYCLIGTALVSTGAHFLTGDYKKGLYTLLATQLASGLYETGRYIKGKIKGKK